MNRILLITLMFLSTLVGAQEVQIPQPKRVVDMTSTLSSQQVETLATKLKQLRESSNVVIGVLIVPSTQPEDIFSFSQRTFDEWKLGQRGVDNGVLIVVAKNDRKMRIHTGYGVENTLTDAKTKQIINDIMGPRFKTGNFYGGIDAAIDAIAAQVKKEGVYAPSPTQKSSGSSVAWFMLGVFGLAALIVLIWLAVETRQRRKRREEEEERLRQEEEYRRLERAREERRRQQLLGIFPGSGAPIAVTRSKSQAKRIEEQRKRRDDDNDMIVPVVVTAAVISSNDSYHSSSYDSSSSYSSSSDNSYSSSDSGGSSGGGGSDGSW